MSFTVLLPKQPSQGTVMLLPGQETFQGLDQEFTPSHPSNQLVFHISTYKPDLKP